jgi:hypothetical protein
VITLPCDLQHYMMFNVGHATWDLDRDQWVDRYLDANRPRQ